MNRMEPIDGESSSEMSPEKADSSSRTKLLSVKPLQQQQQEPSPHPFEELSSLTMPPESNDGASTEPTTGTSQSKSGRLSFRKGRTADEWNRLWQHTNHPVQPPETPIFGRAREVDFLQQQVHDILKHCETSKSLSSSAVAADNNNYLPIQCVLIEGAAGSGKSCLVEERRLLQNMDSINPVSEQEDPQENNQPERTTSFTPRVSFRRSKTSLKRNTSQNTSASTSSTTPQKPTHKRPRATTIYYLSTKFDDSKQRYRGLGAIGKLLGTLASKVLSMDDDEDKKSILQQLRASFSQDDVAHMRQVWPHEAALWEVFPPPTTSSCDDDSETLLTARDPSSSHPDPSSSGINDPGESESFTATSSTAGLASGDLGKLLGSTASSDDTVRFLGNLVKLFVKTIAASHSTRAVVLVVDDLQWLDEMSLQILDSLIHPDPQHTRASVEESTSSSTALLSNEPPASWRHKILFLGLHRPLEGETARNSSSSNHLPTAINPRPFVQEWLNGATMQSAKRLKLSNLSLTSVQELLADLLSTPDSKADKNNRPEDDPKLHQLASLVHNRTHGNPFYIRQLIKALQESGLIQYTEVKENRPSTMGLYGIARQSEARGMGGYLQYRWTWDTEEIEASQILFGSQESIQIVMERLRHFSVGVQNCLQLASCIGPKFELRLLAPIMEHFQGIEQETNSQQTVQWTWEWDKIYSKLVVALTVFAVRTLVYLFCVLVGIPPPKAPETSIYDILSPHSLLAFSLEDLETALTEGLLEQTHHHKTTSRDNLQYRFAHDKIFETSLSLRVSSPFEREALHLEIGRALVKKFIPSKAIRRCRSSPMIALEKVDDAIIFVCTDQLNYARQMLVSNAQYAKENSKEEALLLVYLNLAAGVRAKSNNSYTFCESYLQTGIELLETLYDKSAESLWDKHDKLVLLFLTRLADVSLCVGNFDAIEGYMTEVSERAGSMDTFHVHFAFLKSLLMNNKIDQLMNESLKLLQKLGMTFNKDSTDFDLKAKREEVFGRLAIMTDHEILELPKLKNKRIFRISQILVGVLSEAMYFAKNQSLLKIMQLCALEAVLDHGISQFSPAAFSFASFAVFDDIDSTRFNASMRLTNLAIALAKQAGGIDDWRNLMVSEGLVFRHWDQPHVANVDDVSRNSRQCHFETEIFTTMLLILLIFCPYLRDSHFTCMSAFSIKENWRKHSRYVPRGIFSRAVKTFSHTFSLSIPIGC